MPTKADGSALPTERLLRLLAGRMEWHVGKQIVTVAGLHAARGWDESITAFRDGVFSDTALEAAEAVLQDAVWWHSYVGNKQVTWYAFKHWKAEWVNAVKPWFDSLPVGNLNHVFHLPAWSHARTPLDQVSLKEHLGKEPKLLEIHKEGQRLYIQYFGVRTYSTRTTIDISDLPDDEQEHFAEFSELIGVKRMLVPCFDSCVLDLEAKRLELRIDYSDGFRAEEQARAAAETLTSINRIFFKHLQITPAGHAIVNFFPAVGKIYEDKAAGQVNLLGFVANGSDTTSNNRGNVQRRQNQDLRNDKFHVGGKNNVHSVLPYTVGATWYAPGTARRLKLELEGSVRMIYQPSKASIEEAAFLGCVDGKEFDFLADELTRQLPAL